MAFRYHEHGDNLQRQRPKGGFITIARTQDTDLARGGSSKCAPGWQRAKARLTVLQLHLKMMYQQFKSGLGAGGDVYEQVETRSASLRF